jgi:hypothetical protein
LRGETAWLDLPATRQLLGISEPRSLAAQVFSKTVAIVHSAIPPRGILQDIFGDLLEESEAGGGDFGVDG